MINILEKKLDALIRAELAEDEASREKVRKALRELTAESAPAPVAVKPNPEKEIRKILTELGMPEHIKGHRCTVEAIKLAVAEPGIIDVIVKGLYVTVAETFGTTASRVERAIRHGIEITWDRGDLDVLGRYFGNTINCSKGKPTNSEFIARLANVVRMKMEDAA